MEKGKDSDKYADLQERVVEILECQLQELQKISVEDIQSLIQDLQTHQAELVQDQLQKSERIYHSLFESMLEGYAYCKMIFEDGVPQDFIYLEVNSAFERLTGLKNVIGKKVSEVIPNIQKSNPELFQIYGRVALTGEPESFETYLESLGIWFSVVVYSPEKEYFIAVFDNITDHKIKEEQVRWNARVNESLAELYKPLTSASSIKEIAGITLAQAQKLTESEFGYIASISSLNGDFIIYTLTDALGCVCRVSDWNKHLAFPKGRDGQYRGLWGYSMNTGKSFFTNSPSTHPSSSGIPEGHVPLGRFLSVPVMLGKEIIGQIALANPDHNYAKRDLEAVKHIAEYYALAIQRKQAELTLKENEEKYRALIESFPDVIMRFDRNARHIYVSDSVTKDSGMLPEQFIGKTHRDFGVPDDICRFWEQSIARIFDTSEAYEKEFEFNGINGPVIYNWRLIPELSESGDVKTVLSIARDITEHRKSEKKYRDVFNSMTDGLALHEIILDEFGSPINYRYIDVNPAFERLTGLKKDSVIGKTVLDIFPKAKPYWVGICGIVASSGEPVHLEEYNEDIGRYFELTVYSPQKGQFVTIFDDITDRKQADELQEKLRQASKLEAIGRLASGVAHDFNNLLTVILGNVLFGKKDLNKSDPLYDILNMIEQAAEQATELTQQLQAFSRKQIIKMKIINLNDLVNNIQKMLTRLIGEDIEFKTILSANIGNVNADHGQIEQIIVNLAINARDAMPDGGKLTIETCNVELDGTYINKHVGINAGKYVMLSISDNGVGMDKDTKKQIFEPFFTTKEFGKGTGLGLAIVYGIVKQHNGSIECYSELGQGTTFKIYLPRVEDDVSISTVEHDHSEVPTGNETILVVEDEDVVRDMVAGFLNKLGYHVLTAKNGDIALMIAEQQENIHLIFTDVVMPLMNGRQIADKLKGSHPEMKVLYTSGYTENIIVHHDILGSGLNFIGKPYLPQTLAKKIRNILDS